MLQEYKFFDIDMKFKNLLPIFYEDPRWINIDDDSK